jgi:murein DD-endopeptidase MepM/ murein hydrolase activator NlpD
LVLVVAPIGLVVVTLLAVAESVPAGFRHTTEPVLAPMLCPVSGATITQGFGPTSASFEPPGFGYPHFHSGVDFGAPVGTPVYAATDGFVELAGVQVDALGVPVGFGNYIKIGAGAYEEEIYGHLSAILVTPNRVVRAGQAIGAVGSTGTSTGPHLHFEMRLRGVPIDPSSALRC